MLILDVDYLFVDFSGRHETPAGRVGQVRPRRSESDEEAHRLPRGKRVPGAEINLYQLRFVCIYEKKPLTKRS